MSLVQHVTAQEGFDNDPTCDNLDSDNASRVSFSLGLTRQRSHSISYGPNLYGDGHAEKLEPIGAYEVSQKRRTAQVLVGVLSCVSASGITFGYAALKSTIVDEQIYRDLCTQDELNENLRLCYLQDQRLNLTFIVASITTNVSALLVGILLDRYGPRVCGMAGSLLLLFGSLSMAFQEELPFDALLVAQFLLAFGGTFIFVPSFHLSNAFPQFQGLVLALITGAFDASAAVFLLFRLLYESSDGNFGLKKFFLVYLVVPILIMVCQLTFMPTRSYETRIELGEKMELVNDASQDVHDSDDELAEGDMWRARSERYEERRQTASEIAELLGTREEREAYGRREEEKKVSSGVWGALHGLPALQQMKSAWFILIVLLTILQMARMNFFISTIWSQYNYMLHSASKANQVNQFFDVSLPIGGVVTVPFIGFLLDQTSTVVILGVLVLLSTAIGILGVIPSLVAAYSNVILFVLLRPLYYSAMSDYAAKVFGFNTFGTVYGTIIALSGLCTFAQSALQALVHDAFNDDPTPVNLVLAALGLFIGTTLVLFLAIQTASMNEEQSSGPDPPITSEREPLLPAQPSQKKKKRPGLLARLSTILEGAERWGQD